MKIIFDLDGPILDVRPRYIHLYRSLAAKHGATGPLLDDAGYWELKRQRIPEKEIVRRSGLPDRRFAAYWNERMALIETEQCLARDRLHPFFEEAIKSLPRLADRYIATLRNRRGPLIRQLDRLGLMSLFCAVLSEDNNAGDAGAKERLVRRSGILDGYIGSLYFVGDTEVDIVTARSLGAVAVAVESGIRNRAVLERERPDALLPDIRGLIPLLERGLQVRDSR
ncbi:MAG TPA: HAD family hydrolase [Nitrospirae bacterium]|nr:HAD family hydrolase [Nitrospirota bacterium]